MTEAVHHPGTVKIDPRQFLVLEGIEAGTFAEGLGSLDMGLSADGLKEGMPGDYPIERPKYGSNS